MKKGSLALSSRPHLGSALSVQVHAPAENFLLLSYATGLSSRGLFVRASRPLPTGTEVRLDLNSHGEQERVVAYGKVIRIHDEPGNRGMEMAFDSSRTDEEPQLQQLVSRYEEDTL